MPSPPSSLTESSPHGFGTRSVRTRAYRKLLADLPTAVQKLSVQLFRKFFRTNPRHPSLGLHELKDRKKSQHKSGSFATSVGVGHRAIFVVDDDTNVWYWIGSHEDYNTFTGK